MIFLKIYDIIVRIQEFELKIDMYLFILLFSNSYRNFEYNKNNINRKSVNIL